VGVDSETRPQPEFIASQRLDNLHRDRQRSGRGFRQHADGHSHLTQSSAVPGTFHPAASCTLVGGTGSVTITVNPEGDGYYVRLTASYAGDSVHERQFLVGAAS
jgi:hypothetical protein